MSWLTRVRNTLPFLAKRDSPDNLWIKCPACGEMVFTKDYEENKRVCPRCDHHGRIGADERLRQLLDEGYELLRLPETADDPLRFRDVKRYADRLKQARARNPADRARQDAFVCARGAIEGHRVVLGVQDFGFMGGSMGVAVGSAFCAGAEEALRQRCGFVVVSAAGGARMQEGILSLMQMPRATVMTRRLRQAGLPYIVVLSDPTTGGVTASYAMLGDVQLAEPGALIGFAGQRVIQDTIREQLPDGFQRAEYLFEHGMVDMVVHRRALRAKLASLLDYLRPAPREAA
jgi:acetyl-CoA carboxylase carboxyl transferase subunit beta